MHQRRQLSATSWLSGARPAAYLGRRAGRAGEMATRRRSYVEAAHGAQRRLVGRILVGRSGTPRERTVTALLQLPLPAPGPTPSNRCASPVQYPTRCREATLREEPRVASPERHGSTHQSGSTSTRQLLLIRVLPGTTTLPQHALPRPDLLTSGSPIAGYACVRGPGGLIQSVAWLGSTAWSTACTSSLRTVSRSMASRSRAVKESTIAPAS
jgi:hypothetical protein